MLAFERAVGEGLAMQSRVHPGLSLVPLLTALLVSGCKTADKQEEIDSGAAPLVSVATADPLPVASAPAPTVLVPTPTPGPATTPKVDAGAPSDAGAPGVDAGKPVDAGATAPGKFAACASKCQAVAQGCALPQITADSGLPQLKDPAACQAAAAACFAACAP
jgi:hypothetical protein